MPTNTLDVRASRLDLLVHPGNAHTFDFVWPAPLTGRTFTATVGATALTVSVNSATVSVTFTEAVTAALTSATAWKLTETTSGTQDRIVGKVIPNAHGTGGQDDTITVTEDGSTITVTVLGEPGTGSAALADGDKGDITVSSSGTVWTIDNGAVTAAKVAADVATQAELDTEAALARNADNLTSGTVAEARIHSSIARDAEVTAAVAGKANTIAQVVNVLDAPYSAANDGTADDRTAIQAAIDAMDAIGGGTVILANSHKIFSSLTLQPNVQVVGHGADQTQVTYTGTGFAVVGDPGNRGGLRGLQLSCPNVTSTGGAIHIPDPSRFHRLEDLRLSGPADGGPGTAVLFSGESSCNCFHVGELLQIENWASGLRFSGDANAMHFRELWFGGVTKCIHVEALAPDTIGAAEILFERVEFTAAAGGSTCIYLRNNPVRLTFVSCKSDGPTVDLDISGQTSPVVLIGCELNGGNTFAAASDRQAIVALGTDLGYNPQTVLPRAHIGLGTPDTGAISWLDLIADGAHIGARIWNRSTSDGRAAIEFRAERGSSKRYQLGIDPDGAATKGFIFRDVTAGADRITVNTTGQVRLHGDVEIEGSLNHDGSTVGFYGTTPATQQAATNLSTLHAALKLYGLISGTFSDPYQPVDADLTAIAAAGNSAVLAATTASFLMADETKLDGIEAGADVTDAAAVAAAGAVMEADTTTAAMSFVVDEDDMASDSATKVPTQQSVKAYVDASGGGGGGAPTDASYVTVSAEAGLSNETTFATALATWIRQVRKASNETVNNSTVLQNDDALLFALAANEVWDFELLLLVDGATGADIKIAFTVPALATVGWYSYAPQLAETGVPITNASGTAAVRFGGHVTGSATSLSVGTMGTGGTNVTGILVKGSVVNGANAGNLTLQWAQVTATGSDTIVMAGSLLTARRVS